MKVLFAVNNDNISEAIIKRYQKKYKEIIKMFTTLMQFLKNYKTINHMIE